MSKSIYLTVDLGINDIEDYLYQDRSKKIWDSLSDEDKWECFDYIWEHQDDSEYEMGLYDGDLCSLLEEWLDSHSKVSESVRCRPFRRPLR